jgi:hypothetical protein
MVQLTDEDRETARKIYDFQKLMHADMLAAFPDGILRSHLTAWIGSFVQMLLLMAPEDDRENIWSDVRTGIRRRFEDGKL